MIERTINTNDDFVSNVFIRNKKNGSHRLILNLINLNTFIEYHHFKMDTIETVINLMRPNCFIGSIDLANAYFLIPVAIEHRRFLKFEWKHQMYQFKVMPNGLSSAPRLFTKILKPISAGGRWNEYEKLDHINVLEMKAGLFGLRSFSEALSNTHVKLNMDSITAVAYLRNMGGSTSRKCNALAQTVWEFYQKHQIWLTAAHLPGHFNVLADEKSRQSMKRLLTPQRKSTSPKRGKRAPLQDAAT